MSVCGQRSWMSLESTAAGAYKYERRFRCRRSENSRAMGRRCHACDFILAKTKLSTRRRPWITFTTFYIIQLLHLHFFFRSLQEPEASAGEVHAVRYDEPSRGILIGRPTDRLVFAWPFSVFPRRRSELRLGATALTYEVAYRSSLLFGSRIKASLAGFCQSIELSLTPLFIVRKTNPSIMFQRVLSHSLSVALFST